MKEARVLRLALVLAVLSCVLVGRLFQMQVVEGAYWRREAFRSRLQTQSLPFHRGRILDRHDTLLAQDERAWDVLFEYRTFRRGHPAGQLLEAYAVVGQAPGGLPACMDQAESLLAGMLRWRPSDLAALRSGARADLLYYMRQLGDFASSLPLREWLESGQAPLGAVFAREFARFPERCAAARDALRRLEQALGMEQGALLAEIERQRLELERRVRGLALREAAGRGARMSAYAVADLLEAEAEAEPAPGDGRRREFLAALARRWHLAEEPSALEVLAGVLTGTGAADEEQERLDQGRLLRHVEAVAPEDLEDVRRGLIREVHSSRVIRLRKDVAFDVVDLIEQDPGAYPGLFVVENPHRDYPGSLAPQILGLVSAPSERELRRYQDLRAEERELARLLERTPDQEQRYALVRGELAAAVAPGEVRGGFGVEATCEETLRGARGSFVVLSEDEERTPTELTYQPPRAGQDVRLSLDAPLQQAAEQAILDGYALAAEEAAVHGYGAAVLEALAQPRCGFVLLDLEDGSVPVLATAPSFDVAEYRRSYSALAADPARPLRHRALAGNFSAAQTPYPGSTFKLVVAVEALAQDAGWWTRPLRCEGQYQPAGAARALLCEGVHGSLSMRAAIEHSCNVYFYRLAETLGYGALERRARLLGFGQPCGLELTARPRAGGFEPSGPNTLLERGAFLLRPAEEARERAAACHLAIGQSYVTTSPLHMARLYGWLATGKLWTPRLIQEQAGAPSAPAYSEPPMPAGAGPLLIQAMQDVVRSGTAADPEHDLSVFGVAGKTGTAQALEARRSGEPEVHGWFAGFFPADAPRYAFAILCENAGVHGGDSANLVLYCFLEATDGLVPR